MFGESVIVWGMLSFEGGGLIVRINGVFNANMYLNLVKQHAATSVQASPN